MRARTSPTIQTSSCRTKPPRIEKVLSAPQSPVGHVVRDVDGGLTRPILVREPFSNRGKPHGISGVLRVQFSDCRASGVVTGITNASPTPHNTREAALILRVPVGVVHSSLRSAELPRKGDSADDRIRRRAANLRGDRVGDGTFASAARRSREIVELKAPPKWPSPILASCWSRR
jgi:hypothetical protein